MCEEVKNMKNTVTALKAHLSLNVKDISKSIGFYQKLFGIEPSKVRLGYAKFDVQNPPLNLALNENSQAGRGPLSHLGIQVASTEDVLETKKQWEDSGLTTKDEMQTNCCYALQDKTWTSDPDGNEWEVFVVLEDNLPQTDYHSVFYIQPAFFPVNPARQACLAKLAPQIHLPVR
jgi:predicted enzyme related to lactoylglutathione lyase